MSKTNQPVELRKLPQSHWPALHRLMLQQAFPAVPEDYDEAEPYLRAVHTYGAFGENGLQAAFLFGERTEESAFLDVVCAPTAHGRWASRKLLRQLGEMAFGLWGLRFLWAETHSAPALKAALQAGFQPTTPLDGESVVLILTPHQFNAMMKQKEM
ncbi:MAG: hypothetical protein WAX89_02770 [Alphaproteobacteria bacterium]